MNTATATGTSLDSSSTPTTNGVTQRANGKGPASSTTESNGTVDLTEELRRSFRRKYRHVEAVHSVSQPSCLSHDTTETPSFLGFRNLMVIMLGMKS
jgi:diacylglycerol O-acyltransferase-1